MRRKSSHSPIISSLQNPAVKSAAKLADRKRRDQTGLMLIEGLRELGRALDSDVEITHIFVCAELLRGDVPKDLIEKVKKRGGRAFNVTQAVFVKLAYREKPDGLLAVARQPKWDLEHLSLGPCPLLVVAVGLEKPGNLGSILRTADAAGADGVIVCDKNTDPANPNVVRASLGTLFTVQLAQATSSETIDWLKRQGIRILSTSPHGSVKYTEVNLRESCAIVVGSEQLGLGREWTDAADASVRIPMFGKGDSLNVAVTTAILLFEAVRQRS